MVGREHGAHAHNWDGFFQNPSRLVRAVGVGRCEGSFGPLPFAVVVAGKTPSHPLSYSGIEPELLN